MSTCRWCKKDHGDEPVRHRDCCICLEPFVQPRSGGRPRETCGKPLCVAIQRYRQVNGRWPPRVWFERYAVAAGLIKLPTKVEKLAAGAPAQKDLFSRGAA